MSTQTASREEKDAAHVDAVLEEMSLPSPEQASRRRMLDYLEQSVGHTLAPFKGVNSNKKINAMMQSAVDARLAAMLQRGQISSYTIDDVALAEDGTISCTVKLPASPLPIELNFAKL